MPCYFGHPHPLLWYCLYLELILYFGTLFFEGAQEMSKQMANNIALKMSKFRFFITF